MSNDYGKKSRRALDHNKTFYWACEQGNMKLAVDMIKKKKFINCRDGFMAALSHGYFEFALDLLKVLVQHRRYNTTYWDDLMYCCCEMRRKDWVEKLVQVISILRNAESLKTPNGLYMHFRSFPFRWNTIFEMACRSGNVNIIQFIMDVNQLNIVVNQVDIHRELRLAIAAGHISVIEYLIEKTNTDFWNEVLNQSIIYGNFPVLIMMVKRGKKYGVKYNWKSIVSKAFFSGHMKIMHFLYFNYCSRLIKITPLSQIQHIRKNICLILNRIKNIKEIIATADCNSVILRYNDIKKMTKIIISRRMRNKKKMNYLLKRFMPCFMIRILIFPFFAFPTK